MEDALRNILCGKDKIEDTIPLPIRMQVSVPDPALIQPSKIEIVKSKFAFERLKIEQKYLRLQEVADKVESNARVHEHKTPKMADIYTKTKSENKNLYIANKKLWRQVKDTKI